jgi:hypothetical protein
MKAWDAKKINEEYTARMVIHERICKEPLFHFLKYEPMGRTILALLADGQISQGKAAEAITEKFCLGLDPPLPKWKGHHDKE